MDVAAVNEYDVPTLTVSMPDFTGMEMENITIRQRMMSSCTGAILTSLFSEFSTVATTVIFCLTSLLLLAAVWLS